MTVPPFTTIGVPIDSVGFRSAEPRGTERSPAVVRAAGLGRLGWGDGGDLDVRIADKVRDPASGVVGARDVLAATGAIRAAVRRRVGDGERPFLLGGCCTLLPGALAGARDVLGEVGLVYVDGHLDLYDGRTSPTGEAADMPIAVLLGRGPDAWNEATAPAPVLAPAAIALLGFRDPDELRDVADVLAEVRASGLLALSADMILHDGPVQSAAAALDHVRDSSRRLWLHVDLDVLGEDVFPATDYLMPGGLGWRQLVDLLRPVAGADDLVGWSVSCYNPDKDPDGRCGRALVDAIEAAFGGS